MGPENITPEEILGVMKLGTFYVNGEKVGEYTAAIAETAKRRHDHATAENDPATR